MKGKKITVMGLGLHGGGIGTVRFLSEIGAQVVVTDLKSKEELAPSLKKLAGLKNVTYVLGQHWPEDFKKVDMVIKTPPVPWTNKYIKMALESNVSVEIDSSLFFKFCRNLIIGVTGTKGKTTTAHLIYKILEAAGISAVEVGVSQISVLDKLKDLKKDSVVVFELSSWRLSALGKHKLSPQIAVITNIFPDHLNYYKSMEEYIKDKKNIFLYQNRKDSSVINGDNAIMRQFEGEIKSQLIKFSKNKVSKGKSVGIDNGIIYFSDGIDERKVMEVREIKLRGEHNLENVLAAIAATCAAGVKLEIIRKVILEFEGIPNRLELVREVNGVKFINDTSATTPEAAIGGINSFSEPIILIAGGSDKNLDMTTFAKIIRDKVRKVIFLKGPATDKIISAIKEMDNNSANSEFKIVGSMEEAVMLAQKETEKGDVVLLSPGAASFGLFTNEFDRGDKFREAVNRLN